MDKSSLRALIRYESRVYLSKGLRIRRLPPQPSPRVLSVSLMLSFLSPMEDDGDEYRLTLTLHQLAG